MTASEHFDQLAPRYAELRAAPAYGDPILEQVVDLGDLRHKRVLDVGCGPGTVVRQLAERYGAEPVGLDPSPEMIAAARAHTGDTIELHVGRAEELPFERASFDAVVMRMVLHHLDRPRAYAEILRVLRPAGRLVITTTDPTRFERFWMRPYFPSYLAIETERFPTGEDLVAELAAAGFSAARAIPVSFPRRFSRETALAKLRGRAYSTFALISEEEYEAGVAAAEASLPPEIEYELTLLHVVAARP